MGESKNTPASIWGLWIVRVSVLLMLFTGYKLAKTFTGDVKLDTAIGWFLFTSCVYFIGMYLKYSKTKKD
ncbi:hypothetical protein EI16_12190 [Hydrogenovibrio marinus]|uniref:Uncharacterized protein n=1 Tax=Hydrogenovibrio marinus TaxID=28885 RepID=A0A066ZMD4_HYDMR|nr:hypothetical protein EI16_12190 [Hydrogenovibrio marinus]